MRISVVIPVHNRREVIDRSIESVVCQSLPPFEIIVVDDGSSDGTADHVRSRFPDVVVLQNADNRGASHARNRGIESAQGDWIAFLDSDDEWRRHKLDRQSIMLADEPDTPLCHTDEIWIRDGVRVNQRQRHKKRGGHIFEYCLALCVISPSSTLVRRDLLVEIGGFDEQLPVCEDYDLWLRICATWSVAFVPQPLLVKYGGHADQLSRRYWGIDRFRIQALEKLLATGPLDPNQRRAVLIMMINKLQILIGGARKRGNHEQAQQWQTQLDLSHRQLSAMSSGAP